MKRTLSNHFIHLHTASSIQKHFLKIESFHLFTWFQPFTYSRKLPQQFPPTHINLSSLLNISCLYKKCYTFCAKVSPSGVVANQISAPLFLPPHSDSVCLPRDFNSAGLRNILNICRHPELNNMVLDSNFLYS